MSSFRMRQYHKDIFVQPRLELRFFNRFHINRQWIFISKFRYLISASKTKVDSGQGQVDQNFFPEGTFFFLLFLQNPYIKSAG